jgi:hypothetical protein
MVDMSPFPFESQNRSRTQFDYSHLPSPYTRQGNNYKVKSMASDVILTEWNQPKLMVDLPSK